MKIRRDYKRGNLKTKSVRLKIFGGDEDYCKLCVGYYVRNGKKLKPSVMLKPYNESVSINPVVSTRYFPNIGAAVFITSTGHVYRWKPVSVGSPFEYAGLLGTTMPFATACYYNNMNVVAVVAGPRIVIVKPSAYEIRGVPYQLRGAAYFLGRMFCADITNDCVRWSGEGITDWSESIDGAGHIYLDPSRGQIFNVVVFGDKLVAFREFGLDVLNVYGEPRHFKVEQYGQQLVTERLTMTTCVECGKKLYFASTHNIYTFDGEKIEQVVLPEYMKGSYYTNGCSYGNRYVHYYCMSDSDGQYYQFELDVVTGKCAFFAPGMKFLWNNGEKFYGFKDNAIYVQDKFGYDVEHVWKSKPVDVGTSGVKTLKNIYTDADDFSRVKITADGVSREVRGQGELPVGLSGREFVFEIKERGETSILEAEWEVR